MNFQLNLKKQNLFNEIQLKSINRKVQISLFKTHLFTLEEFHRNQNQTYTANQNRKRLHLSSIRKSSGHLAQFLTLSSRVFRHKGIYKYRDIMQKWWKQKIKLMARTAGPAITKIF